jgi:four helix bundle protein
MRNFKKLRIWQKGIEIAVDCFLLTAEFPSDQRFALTLQITKAGTSIPANIAEGSSRTSTKEYIHYLEISLGSAYELETHITVAEKMDFGKPELRKILLKNLDDQEKMTSGLIERLKGS